MKTAGTKAIGTKPVPHARARDAVAAEWIPLDSLVPWAANPRKNDGRAVDSVAKALQELGVGAPIVARVSDRRIIAGHTRWKAATSLLSASAKKRSRWHDDAKRVAETGAFPVRLIEADDDAAAKLAIADNRLNEIAEWDLTELDRLIGSFDPDDMQLLGWTTEEYRQLVREGGGGVAKSPDDVVEVDVGEIPENPITQLGDVWKLGRHRLVCGDSRSKETWTRLMLTERADAIWTDPPYGVAYVGKTKDAFTRPGAAWYVAAPAGPPHLLFMAAMKDRGVLRQALVWVKDQFVMGRSDYHYRHEPVLYGWTPGGTHHFIGDRTLDSVLEFARPRQNKEHPTMKPIELVAKCIHNSTVPGEIVAEPFGGSGTTLLACEQLDRSCRAIELDPKYCDVIVSRWERLTNNKAERSS